MLYFAFTAHHVNIWRQTSWLVSRINQNILKWNLEEKRYCKYLNLLN